jgi:hypothetical protein
VPKRKQIRNELWTATHQLMTGLRQRPRCAKVLIKDEYGEIEYGGFPINQSRTHWCRNGSTSAAISKSVSQWISVTSWWPVGDETPAWNGLFSALAGNRDHHGQHVVSRKPNDRPISGVFMHMVT